MKNIKSLTFIICSLLLCSCSPNNNSKQQNEEDTIKKKPDTTTNKAAQESSSKIDSPSYNNAAVTAKSFLQGHFKEDITKNLIDSNSRSFKLEEADLNNDGTNEIFIGLSGGYFCGSGGCTLFIISNKGELISNFSVVKYPVYIGPTINKGFKDLIMYSGGKNRLVVFNGKKYPSNPSVAPAYKQETSGLVEIFKNAESNLEKF